VVSIFGALRKHCREHMRILSLETATYFGGVAYVSDEDREAVGPFAPRESSRQVLAAAHALLERHGCEKDGPDLVAVSTGPGLFTGVRVGLSIAKTLVWAQGHAGSTALVGVPTLQAVAALAANGRDDSAQPGDLVIAVTDARRGEVYAALFQVLEPRNPESADPLGKKTHGDQPRRVSQTSSASQTRRVSHLRQVAPALKPLSDDIVVRPDRLVATLFHAEAKAESPEAQAEGDVADAPVWLVGDGMDRYGEILLGQFKGRARVFARGQENLALQVADLGRRRFEEDLAQSPGDVRPHYVRRPDARLPVAQFLAGKT
jgi:tRNA threonylcarbamoyl adenosine modification protein YeaZ